MPDFNELFGILRGRKHIIVMGCVLQGLVTMLLSVIDQMLGGMACWVRHAFCGLLFA